MKVKLKKREYNRVSVKVTVGIQELYSIIMTSQDDAVKTIHDYITPRHCSIDTNDPSKVVIRVEGATNY